MCRPSGPAREGRLRLRICALALGALLLTGCEAGGFSPFNILSPASPTPTTSETTTPADVGGTWTAVLSASTDDVQGGGCAGNVARALGSSITRSTTFVLTQNGGTLPATSVTINGITCQFRGSVTGTTVNATVDSCTPDAISLGALIGCGSDAWSFEAPSLTMAATVTGDTITGTPTVTGTATNGSESHPVSATARLTMTR